MDMNKVFVFILGAATGSLVTWKLVEKKYKKIADKEIEAVMEYHKIKEEDRFGAKHIVVSKTDESVEEIEDEEELEPLDTGVIDYVNKVEELGYNNEEEVVVLEPTNEYVAPYVISPDEFGEAYDYDTLYFTYYADGVITDDTGEIIEDVESIIGDALEHFGDYDDNAVHVRNENDGVDIEIIKEEKTFEEINREDD